MFPGTWWSVERLDERTDSDGVYLHKLKTPRTGAFMTCWVSQKPSHHNILKVRINHSSVCPLIALVSLVWGEMAQLF